MPFANLFSRIPFVFMGASGTPDDWASADYLRGCLRLSVMVPLRTHGMRI